VTYGTALGRVVLLHALATIGLIGQPRAAETQDQSNHTNGRGWAVLEMARLAGFDHVAISAAGLTQTLEGAHYDRHNHGHHDDHGPAIVRFGDDDRFDGGAADDGPGLDFESGGPVR
jgi:hypothetical protein